MKEIVRIHFWYKPALASKKTGTVDVYVELPKHENIDDLDGFFEDILMTAMENDITADDAGIDNFGFICASFKLIKPPKFYTTGTMYDVPHNLQQTLVKE